MTTSELAFFTLAGRGLIAFVFLVFVWLGYDIHKHPEKTGLSMVDVVTGLVVIAIAYLIASIWL